jgi:DNA-binding MarR family transcriptional regulator
VDRYLSVSFLVMKRAVTLVKSGLDQDITADQFFMMRHIQQTGYSTSTHLAETFEVNKSAITAMTNRLVDKGFLTRVRDEKDRRVVYLSLSPKGEEWLKHTEEKIYQLVQTLVSHFKDQEIEDFIQTYEKLADLLRRMEQQE